MTPTYRSTARHKTLAFSACLLMTLMTFAFPAAAVPPAPTQYFDLPAQPLDVALVTFGELTGYSVLVASHLVTGRVAPAVAGDYTPAVALQLLLVGTHLGVRFSGSNAFTLVPLAGVPDAVASARVSDLPAYAAVVQRAITRSLCRLHPDAFGRYRLAFQLWLDARGNVRQVRLLESSGMAQRDEAVVRRLGKLAMDSAPPPGLAQPLTILLAPRPEPASDCQPFLYGAG